MFALRFIVSFALLTKRAVAHLDPSLTQKAALVQDDN
jgi:hypothetical protein